MSADLPNRVGETLGHYRIVRKIDEGGMCEVYEAVDIHLERPAALKLLHPHLWGDARARERFIREAKAASSLDHDNVCVIYEIGEIGADNKTPFIAMALYEGETLAEKIRRRPLPLQEVASYGAQVAAGLIVAHEQGIVHRDIKPQNIIVRRDGVAKILDFGVAKLKQAASLTRTDSVVGTPLYMSPEQCVGGEVDHRSDVWGLGAVLYEMITGRPAFDDENRAAIPYRISNEEPVPIASLRPETPASLVKVVERALEKDPDERYANMAQLRADLEKVMLEWPKDPPSGPNTTAEAPRGSRRFARWLVSGVLAAAVAGVFWGDWSRNGAGPAPAEISSTADPVSQRSFAYWISVQRYRDGAPYREPFRLEHEMVFEADYRIFLHLELSQDGYLYVVNEGPDSDPSAPAYNLLFPKTTIHDGEPRLTAGQTVQLPESGGFRFDEEVGKETVWFIWTREPASPLEAVKGLANSRDLGVIADQAQALAVREFLARHSRRPARVERLSAEQMTRVAGPEDVVVYPLVLEHR